MKAIAIVGITAWLAGVGFGVREIVAYSTAPGERAEAPATWPADSLLARAPDRPTIVMFVHPECPCTRASLAELSEIARGDRAAIRIALADSGEAARFGARTSGHVVVYDAAGTLRYAGGITGSRGHQGDNVGRRKVEAIIAGAGERDTSYPVFGCAL